MRNIKALALALVAVFAMSIVVAAAASAHEFVAAPSNGVFPSNVLGSGGKQEFKAGFGTITCEHATATSQANTNKEATTVQKVSYTGKCNAGLGGTVEEPINAEYEFSAEGSVKVLKEIVIKVTGSGCSVKIPVQGPLTSVTYTNNAAKTEITGTANVSGIRSIGSGGFCGGENTTGTYKGAITSMLEVGGKLEWV